MALVNGTGYTKLETTELKQVQAFVAQNASELEAAELSIRSSAGTFIAELRSTDEPIS